MSDKISKLSISLSVDADYDAARVDQEFNKLTAEWPDHDFRLKNTHWVLADHLKLMPGIVSYQIDGFPLTDLFGRELSFGVESIMYHAYELLWGGAFTQTFSKPYTLDIEGSGTRFQLARNGDLLRMTCNSESIHSDILYLEPLQFLKALSDYYEATIRTMFTLHKPLRSNMAFMRGIPFIQFIDYYASISN